MPINREQVHGKYGGRCAYCGKEITLKQMQVDHIWPKHVGGKDDFDNLNPSCRQCNHYKRGDNLNQFRITMKTLHERVEKIYIHRVAVNFGMATIRPWDGRFYFEKIINELKVDYPEQTILQAIEKVKSKSQNPSE
jgi:hypothetical protein